MPELATQVREALIEQSAEELYQLLSSGDEQKKMAEEVAREMVDAFVLSAADILYVDEDLEKEIRKEFEDGIREQVSRLYNPEQLREITRQQARSNYKTEEEYKAELGSHIAELKEDKDIEDDVITEYEKSYDIVIGFIRDRDRIIKRLVEIAEKEGVEKAAQKETRYAIIRELFPTREDYKTFQKRTVEELEGFYSQAGNALMQDGEFGQLAGRIMNSMARIIQKFKEKFKQVQAAYLEKELDAIYGK